MAYVSAKRLHEQRLVFEDQTLERGTLFPFFDRQGIVESLLVIDLQRGATRVLPFEKPKRGTLVAIPYFTKPIAVRATFSELSKVTMDQAAALGRLWHFDPWWLLRDAPFAARPTTPTLKATNCVPFLERKEPNLTFRRDLSSTRYLYDHGDPQFPGAPWKAEFVPEHHPEVILPPRGRARGVLDPVWAPGLR